MDDGGNWSARQDLHLHRALIECDRGYKPRCALYTTRRNWRRGRVLPPQSVAERRFSKPVRKADYPRPLRNWCAEPELHWQATGFKPVRYAGSRHRRKLVGEAGFAPGNSKV